MKQKEIEFIKDEKSYKVIVTYKWIRNSYYQYRDGVFYVSAPYGMLPGMILKQIDKFYPRLTKQNSTNVEHFSFENDFVYLLGEKVSLSSLNIKNDDELRLFLKKEASKVISEEVRKYEQIMDINNPYKIRIKETVRQYGSNSKRTHSLSFQTSLIHYSLEIIDTVVVHELAHEYQRNHQKAFYDIVYKYSPNYKTLQRKLKRGIHQ